MHARAQALRPVAAALLLLLAACGDPPPAPSGEEPAAPPAVAGSAPAVPDRAEAEPPVAGAPLDGTWWALSRQAPYLAFRLDLEPATAPGRYGGTAVVFDWRDTPDGRELSRPSRRVEVHGHWDPVARRGEISGPMPMIGTDGVPNGHRGQWRLADLEPAPGGDGWRFTGRLHHTELTGRDGLPLELERAFRPWRREP